MTSSDNTKRRTVAYIRVANDDQTTDGNSFSLSDQERQTRAQAIAHDWPDVAEVYADTGVSGATRDRPALNRLLADAKAGTIGRVIVTRLDRMSRRAVDLLAIEDALDQCGVERLYINDGIDTTAPVGRLLSTGRAAGSARQTASPEGPREEVEVWDRDHATTDSEGER